MGTRWDSAQTAEGFEAYDDLPERVLGYPAVFEAIGLGRPDVRTVLDYGCGPGKVAARMVRRCPWARVVAADASPAMLDIARRKRSDPRIGYHLLDGQRLPFLEADRVDAAISCYVFINIGSWATIESIVAEVYRVLRPGGRYAVLDTNPDTTGIAFATFRSGDPDRRYHPGEQRRVLLDRPGSEPLELLDYHWPKASYRRLFESAGFRQIRILEPLLPSPTTGPPAEPARRAERAELTGPAEPVGLAKPEELTETAGWTSERTHPPFIVVQGTK